MPRTLIPEPGESVAPARASRPAAKVAAGRRLPPPVVKPRQSRSTDRNDAGTPKAQGRDWSGRSFPAAAPAPAATARSASPQPSSTSQPEWEIAHKRPHSGGSGPTEASVATLRKGAQYVAFSEAAVRLLTGVGEGMATPKSFHVRVLVDRKLLLLAFRVAQPSDERSATMKCSLMDGSGRWQVGIGDSAARLGIAGRKSQRDLVLKAYGNGVWGFSVNPEPAS